MKRARLEIRLGDSEMIRWWTGTKLFGPDWLTPAL
jgi:hypothetical protein